MKPEVLEDEISRKLAEAAASGELRSAANYGKPLEDDEGWNQTPEEFRMPFKILKNSGAVPPEIEMFHERARLTKVLQNAVTDQEREIARRALTEQEQRIALRLEALRISGKF